MNQKNKKKSNFLYFLPVIGVFILLFFFTSISTVFFFYVKYRSAKTTYEDKFTGNLKNYIFEDSDGIKLISISQVHEGKKIDSYFLKIINPISKYKKEIKLSDDFDNTYKEPYIIGEHNSLLWLYNQGLSAYDHHKLSRAIETKNILDNNPFLLEILKSKNTSYYFDNKSSGIIISGKKNYLLNTDKLTVSKFSEHINPNNDKTKITIDKAQLEDSQHSEVILKGKKYKSLFIRKKLNGSITDSKVKTNLSFINGQFLFDTTDNKIVEINNPHAVVIIHNDANTNNGKDFTISSIGLDGKRQWIMFQSDIGINNDTTESVSIDKAHLNNNQLVFITSNPGSAFALDAHNGSILWKY